MYPRKSISIMLEYGDHKIHMRLSKKRDIPKLNVWCGLMHNQIIGPFIFAESTIIADIYLDILKHYVVYQLLEFPPWVAF